jgi:hypothetical protein
MTGNRPVLYFFFTVLILVLCTTLCDVKPDAGYRSTPASPVRILGYFATRLIGLEASYHVPPRHATVTVLPINKPLTPRRGQGASDRPVEISQALASQAV